MTTAADALEDIAKDQLLTTYRREDARLRGIAKGLLTALEARPGQFHEWPEEMLGEQARGIGPGWAHVVEAQWELQARAAIAAAKEKP